LRYSNTCFCLTSTILDKKDHFKENIRNQNTNHKRSHWQNLCRCFLCISILCLNIVIYHVKSSLLMYILYDSNVWKFLHCCCWVHKHIDKCLFYQWWVFYLLFNNGFILLFSSWIWKIIWCTRNS
jgi:hypothetical protein